MLIYLYGNEVFRIVTVMRVKNCKTPSPTSNDWNPKEGTMRHSILAAVFLTAYFLGGPALADENRAELNTLAVIYNGGEYARATVELKKYVAKYPKDSLAWTILGHAFEELDQDTNAEEAYESALIADPRAYQAITGLGILARKQGELEKAEGYYNQALGIHPSYAEAYSSLVMIAIKRGDFEGAVAYGEKGYALAPNNGVITANLAVAHHYAGDLNRRDEMTEVARLLNYRNMEKLRLIYKGDLDVR